MGGTCGSSEGIVPALRLRLVMLDEWCRRANASSAVIEGDTMALSPKVCTSLEKRTRGASDRVERMLGEPDGGGLYSCIDKRWPSRLRGGVVASMFCAEGGVVMGDVSMCS